MNERTGIYKIIGLYGVHGPIGEGAECSRRVAGRIVRIDVRADQEQIVTVPALQKFVHRTVRWKRSFPDVGRLHVNINEPRRMQFDRASSEPDR